MTGPKKKAAPKESAADSLKRQKAAQAAHQCKACMQTFANVSKKAVLTQHIEKHKGKTMADCFTTFDSARD